MNIPRVLHWPQRNERPSEQSPREEPRNPGIPPRFEPRRSRRPEIASVTGPLDNLRDRRVLAVFDIENCLGGARDLGCRLRFDRLMHVLAKASRSLWAHAVFSTATGDDRLYDMLTQAGYTCHVREARTVMSRGRTVRTTNSDFRVAGAVAYLSRTSPADLIILATGDGDLGDSIAEDIRHFARKRREVATLSLAGSTSYRLDATRNPNISLNIEIGLDVLTPFEGRRRDGDGNQRRF